MGAWGAGLYENDTALDVKDEFEKLFNDGKSVQEITDGLTAEFESIMDCTDEAPLFWLALADTQWKFGVLLPDVKAKQRILQMERGKGKHWMTYRQSCFRRCRR